LAGHAAIAINNASLYQQSERHLKRIEAINEIDNAIASTLSLDRVLNVLLERIELFCSIVVATGVRLLDKETGRLIPIAARNIPLEEWREQIGHAKGILSRQLQVSDAPITIANMLTDSRTSLHDFARRYGLVSYLGVPLIVKDEFIGTLVIYTKEEHEFTPEEIEFFRTLAGQAAIAIHNAQLYEETARSKQELETTNRYLEKSLQQLGGLYTALTPIAPAATTQEMLSGIVGRLMEATGADAALIRLSDKNAGGHPILNQRGFSDEFAQLVGMAPAGGAVDWVVRNAAPLIAPDLASDTRFKSNAQLRLGFRSCAILPLKVHEEVRGVIHVSSRKAGYFDHEQENNLLAIARQMGIAMENRELFYNLESSRDEIEQANTALTESNRRLSALRAVAAASSQSLNLDRVLDSAIQKITDIFHFDATQIHVYDKQLDELRLKASFENDPARFTAARSFKIGQGIVGKVAQTGEKLIFTDVQTDPSYGKFSRTKTSGQHGYHFFAVFPMKGKTQTLGTIACIGNHRRELATSEVQLLEAISDQLAVATENGELYDDVRLKVEQVQQKTAELEQANKIKDEFLGVVSHELRTPLNVIMGYTALFKDGVFGEIKPAQEDALAKLVRESENLLAMIDSILQATVLDTERIVVESQEFSLESLLAELRANYAVTVPRQLSIRWNYPTDLPPLKTDRRKLKQILDNIIGNAVKFTEQGQVTVSAALCEAPASESEACVVDRKNGKLHPAPETPQPWIEFKVADTGAGISSDALTRIFDKFFQADSSETRRYGGVGIGLYIVKKFTELLGGKIKAESPVGGGSTFTVYIPRKIPGKILSETVDSTEAQSQTDN